MKIKVIVGSILLLHGNLSTVYSKVTHKEQNHTNLGSFGGTYEGLPIEENKAEEDKNSKEGVLFLKLHGDMVMKPSIGIAGSKLKSANDVGANLHFKADVPGVLANKNAEVNINLGLGIKKINFDEAMVTLGKYALGYGTTFFAYEKANAALPISVDASILLFKFEDTFDNLRWGFAIERAIGVKVGRFDNKQQAQLNNKQQAQQEEEKEEEKVNKLDDDKKSPFKLKNDIPALSLKVAVVTDRFNIALGGLVRLTNYTHSSDPKQQNKGGADFSKPSWGLNVGIQCKEGKGTFTGQGVYLYGLGDYVSGLAAIQNDEERKEMSTFYYLDSSKNDLKAMVAYGGGVTLEYAITSKCTVAAAVAYLTMPNDNKDKPDIAFQDQLKLILPKITYKFNDHLQIMGNCDMVKENKVHSGKNEPVKYKLNSSIKFNF